ncbi:MAG: hypothetical protein J7M19_00835 [Planctomycetes bacterium]|nr:hypothetical protein [Planctomycetota bacterium]
MRKERTMWCVGMLVACALFASLAVSLEAAPVTPAPVVPSAPSYRAVVVALPPDIEGPNPLADAAWEQAEVFGSLYAKGMPEADDRHTEVRMLICSGTLYIGARCAEPKLDGVKPGEKEMMTRWDGEETLTDDLVDLYFTQTSEAVFPYVRIMINAAGHCRALCYPRPFGQYKETVPFEELDAGGIRVRTGTSETGWWVVAAIPTAEFGIPERECYANVLRNRTSDNSRYGWVQLEARSVNCPYYFGHIVATDRPLEPRASLALPATLAVGANRLHLDDWEDDFHLRVAGKEVPVDEAGDAAVEIDDRGTVFVDILDSAGKAIQTYRANIKRPFIVEAAEAFVADMDKPLRLTLRLNIVAGTAADVAVEVLQNGKRIGHKSVELASGLHNVEMPLSDGKAGEVRIFATANVPGLSQEPIRLTAFHWYLRGVAQTEVDRFREGIDDLDLRGLYRAGTADAGNFLRLTQGGDGRYRFVSESGELHRSEWFYCGVYTLALLYKADWPENPWRGDERFLASAVAGMEAGIDPGGEYTAGGYDRHLQAYLLVYELLHDEVEPERAEYWYKRLVEITEGVLDNPVHPAESLCSLYSDYIGTSTNHFAYFAADVYTAGRVLERPDWLQLGETLMLRLAAHEKDGGFHERRDVPVVGYNWLSVNALGEYYFQSGDERVLANLKRCAEFCCRTMLPNLTIMLAWDGRTNAYWTPMYGHFVLLLTPHGRALAHKRALRDISSTSRPGRFNPEYWFRMAENAVYAVPGEEAGLPEEEEFVFLAGRGLIMRREGFIYGLCAICVPPTKRRFWLDPQNTVELHHARTGPILHGANSYDHPEGGSFFKRGTDGTVFLPKDGTIERLPGGGHIVRLEFDTFTTRLSCRVLGAATAEVRVELLSSEGDTPVVYSFFPAVSKAEEPLVEDAGRTLKFGDVTLQCSRPVEIERDFKITSPYGLTRTVDTKPVRAYVNLEEKHPFLLRVEIEKNPGR